jgi:predicted MFS family arabinose efflux permease
MALVLSLPLHDEPGLAAGRVDRSGFLAALGQRDLLPLWWMTGAFSLVLTGFFTFLKTYVAETGIGTVGLFFAAYSAAAIFVRLVAARLPDVVGPRKVIFPAFGLVVAGFVVLAVASADAHVAVAGVLCGAGHGFAFPILYGLVVTRARIGDRGSAVAIFTSLFDVGLLAGGPALGAVIAIGGYGAMYMTAAGLLAAATVVYASWDRRTVPAQTV